MSFSRPRKPWRFPMVLGSSMNSSNGFFVKWALCEHCGKPLGLSLRSRHHRNFTHQSKLEARETCTFLVLLWLLPIALCWYSSTCCLIVWCARGICFNVASHYLHHYSGDLGTDHNACQVHLWNTCFCNSHPLDTADKLSPCPWKVIELLCQICVGTTYLLSFSSFQIP